MNDPVRELYSEKRYPALSHPVTDPAHLAVSARLAGLQRLAMPEACRVIELGCATGHNLLPLAARYPESDFMGLDYSDTAIRKARQASYESGLHNVLFETADLEHWRPSHPCDYLIVHGVFSWVPDPVKARVLDLCGQVLSDSGVVCISYNTLPGWSLKRDLVPLVRALAANPAAQGLGGSIEAVAASLAEMAGSSTPHALNLQAVCGEMVRKGEDVLSFDDFAPVCDAVYFGQFAGWAAQRGLRYLGEANLRDNLPDGIDPGALQRLAPLATDPLLLQQTLDLLSGRTHRVSLFCRADAPLEEGTTTAVVLQFAAGRGEMELPSLAGEGMLIAIFRQELADAGNSCLPVRELMERTAERLAGGWDPSKHSRELAGWLFQAARLGGIELRADEVAIPVEVPEFPALSKLNLYFAAKGLPVVDARHVSCHFPAGHEQLLAAMDGTRSRSELGLMARTGFPELDFERWILHLTERGLVS